MVFPPFAESTVGADKEALLGWGSFGKHVADIGPKKSADFWPPRQHRKVFSWSGQRGVDLVNDFDQARST